MKKIYFSDIDIKAHVHRILRDISLDNYRPDYVVGLTRGGLVPANMISQYLDIPMHTLKISLRDDPDHKESTDWIVRDAEAGRNILIVDDINDTGATLNFIQNLWSADSLTRVRYAVLVNNEASNFKNIDYSANLINKIGRAHV